ncbi:MAG: hypothetical protein KC910_24835 [Candidatus Eremiobacteraeota bacterium]|nr:hypothetical protein [Candidatus Eremiobacteraeota bacterium]
MLPEISLEAGELAITGAFPGLTHQELEKRLGESVEVEPRLRRWSFAKGVGCLVRFDSQGTAVEVQGSHLMSSTGRVEPGATRKQVEGLLGEAWHEGFGDKSGYQLFLENAEFGEASQVELALAIIAHFRKEKRAWVFERAVALLTPAEDAGPALISELEEVLD